MPDIYDLEDLLRAVEFSRLPKQHSQRTPKCPHPSLYIRYARTGWPKELAGHAGACEYCQKSKAAAWSIECPGWGELKNYLHDPNYPDRMAVERHLEWAGCDVCAARLKLLKLPTHSIRRTGNWFTAILNTKTGTATCILDARLSIKVALDEKSGSIVVQLTTKDSILAGRALDCRLAGQRFETRCELIFKRFNDEEWRDTIAVPSSEERLRDLWGKSFVSVKLREQDAADELASTEMNGIHAAKGQHLAIPVGDHSDAQRLPKSIPEIKELVSAAFEAVVRRVKVEKRSFRSVAFAGSRRTQSKITKLILNVDELHMLDLRPYVRLDLRKDREQWKAEFSLQRELHPTERGRSIEGKTGTIEVSIVRPKKEGRISVRLGSHMRGNFTTMREQCLEDYQPGEEREWDAEVLIRSGAIWDE